MECFCINCAYLVLNRNMVSLTSALSFTVCFRPKTSITNVAIQGMCLCVTLTDRNVCANAISNASNAHYIDVTLVPYICSHCTLSNWVFAAFRHGQVELCNSGFRRHTASIKYSLVQ